MKYHYIYILTNPTHTKLFTGITHNLRLKVRSRSKKLVYFEVYEDFAQALKRIKRLKTTSRLKRFDMVMKTNPEFESLNEEVNLLPD